MEVSGATTPVPDIGPRNSPLDTSRMASLDVLRGFAMFWVVFGSLILEPETGLASMGLSATPLIKPDGFDVAHPAGRSVMVVGAAFASGTVDATYPF